MFTSRLALIVCLLVGAAPNAFAAGANVLTATAEQKQSAQARYGSALEDYEKEAYEPALAGFRASYEIVASPNSRLMAARCLMRLERHVEAYAEFEETAKQAEELAKQNPDYAETAKAAREHQAELHGKVARLTVRVSGAPPGSTLTVAGREVPMNAEPQVLAPGTVEVVLRVPEAEPDVRRVELMGGGEREVEFKPAPPEPPGTHQPGKHPAYTIEVEGHVALTAFDPPGDGQPGVGPGFRVTVDLLDNGPFPNLNNTLGISAGAHFIAIGPGTHGFVPITAQWNLWFSDKFAAFAEPGVGIVFGDGTFVRPAAYGGIRYLLSDQLALVARMGYPNFTVGVSGLF